MQTLTCDYCETPFGYSDENVYTTLFCSKACMQGAEQDYNSIVAIAQRKANREKQEALEMAKRGTFPAFEEFKEEQKRRQGTV
jgi:F0F1-type ATP synthase membrane subunit b/b'